MKYHRAILGGTFDHFHAGHKKLINAAFQEANEITIGVTTESFYQHKLLASEIEPYETRYSHLTEYLTSQGYTSQATIMQLMDMYGPALQEKHIDAIFVTEDTFSGAQKVNAERKKINFPPLDIVMVDFALATDGNPITSERIRLGDIDTQGIVYAEAFTTRQTLTLPASLRKTLRTPIGEVFTEGREILSMERSFLMTVGDIVTNDFLQMGVQPDISIIDLKTQRHDLQRKEKQLLTSLITTTFTNAPGTISTTFFKEFTSLRDHVIKHEKKQVLHILGEEDLLTLPVVLVAPLNTIVVYGQQDVGAICIKVTPEKKRVVAALLQQFC